MVVQSESFNEPTCNGVIYVEEYDVVIKGRIHEQVDGAVTYRAATPMDRRASYTGSGLPFANADQAFDDTPNQGSFKLELHNEFQVKLIMPNSYYRALGTVLVPPTLYLQYQSHGKERRISIKISDGVPFRMLTYPSSMTMPRRDAMFYSGMTELPVRNQEEILRSSGYPDKNRMPANFWGARPPV